MKHRFARVRPISVRDAQLGFTRLPVIPLLLCLFTMLYVFVSNGLIGPKENDVIPGISFLLGIVVITISLSLVGEREARFLGTKKPVTWRIMIVFLTGSLLVFYGSYSALLRPVTIVNALFAYVGAFISISVYILRAKLRYLQYLKMTRASLIRGFSPNLFLLALLTILILVALPRIF